jgi:hypothetical protein
MLTPDVRIDRRILLEAQALTAAGYELFVIAGGDATTPDRFEVVDDIRVERIDPAARSSQQEQIADYQRAAINTLNRVASVVNTSVARLSSTGDGVLARAADTAAQRYGLVRQNVARGLRVGRRAYARALTATLRAFNHAINGSGRAVNASAALAGRAVARVNGLSPYEMGLFGAASFYRPDIVQSTTSLCFA